MCNLPECETATVEQIVQTSVPGTKQIRLRTCPDCDRRRCPNCKSRVDNPTATTCPNGHGI